MIISEYILLVNYYLHNYFQTLPINVCKTATTRVTCLIRSQSHSTTTLKYIYDKRNIIDIQKNIHSWTETTLYYLPTNKLSFPFQISSCRFVRGNVVDALKSRTWHSIQNHTFEPKMTKTHIPTQKTHQINSNYIHTIHIIFFITIHSKFIYLGIHY